VLETKVRFGRITGPNQVFRSHLYSLYRKLRADLSKLDRLDALRVIWAFTQYLQLDAFEIPADIEVDRRFYELAEPRAWINEWVLMLLAKEILIHSGPVAKAGLTLRNWRTLAGTVNGLNILENEIYGAYGSPDKILVEFIRIAHRTFEWQGNGPNQSAIVRYYKIFETPEISEICFRRYGVTVYEVMACGTAMLGHFVESHMLRLPLTSQIAELPVDKFAAVLAFVADDVASIRAILKSEQQFNESFAYSYNSLRARPIIFMGSGVGEVAVCPIPTLLFWRFTAGLYYDLIGVPTFANLFGDSYQSYVGSVLRAAAPLRTIFEECPYKVASKHKRTVDWIVVDADGSALFIECKVKRTRWETKQSLSDTSALEEDIGHLATAVVQNYKTIRDCLAGHYPNFRASSNASIYPCVVTLENWHMHGSVMYGVLRKAVLEKMKEEDVPEEYLTTMPYSVWPVDDFEVGMQVMNTVPISTFMDGKLRDKETRDWEWRPYMSARFKGVFKALFAEDYKKLFAEFRSV
jgi:hypothetical protein